jgi:branched-subunit amino acid aminotransferase/4-amino-4-deoxychorismate lyase
VVFLNVVEELSGMNVFSFDDGSFQTSPFTDMILSGIAGDSLIVLVRDLGWWCAKSLQNSHSRDADRPA